MLERHATYNDHQATIVAKSMERTMTRAVVAALAGKERAVDAAMKAVYWLCKEGVTTQKYSSLLLLLEPYNTLVLPPLKKWMQ